MESSDKLSQLYSIGYTRADVARLTRRTDETIAAWEEDAVGESDEGALSLLMRITPSEFRSFLEQQRALDELTGKGIRRTQIARLVGVGVNSVRAWDRAMKLARGRARERLLSHARMTADQLSKLVPHQPIERGRLPPEEIARRTAAMKEAGLWPFEERARRLRRLLERAGRASISTSEVIDLLGVGRRAFYESLSAASARLLPIETVKRYQHLSASLGSFKGSESDPSPPLTLEERFIRASLLLFEEYHYVGFALRDPVKESALRMLAQATGYHERTLRRYLPQRVDRRRRMPRMVVEAFEEVARSHGSLVREKL